MTDNTMRRWSTRLLQPPRRTIDRNRVSRLLHQPRDATGGKLRHLSIGQAHKGKRVVLLVDDRDVRVHSVQGQFLRGLRIDPRKIYQGQSA
jgi:hypothetical protein